MVFDYDEEIRKVTRKVDILNLNGRNQVKVILEYLRECPFFEVVAEHLGISVSAIYFKLKYYLGEKKVRDLNLDVRARRKACLEDYKNDLQEILENMDVSGSNENKHKNGGD